MRDQKTPHEYLYSPLSGQDPAVLDSSCVPETNSKMKLFAENGVQAKKHVRYWHSLCDGHHNRFWVI